MKTIICLSLGIVCALQATLAQNLPMPDLIIRGNEFTFEGNKIVHVYISNNGSGPSQRCSLELTVRKIEKAHVARVTTAVIPGLQPGDYAEISVNAAKILPRAVSLKDTIFKVTADSTKRNVESNEDNNEKWHNLQ